MRISGWLLATGLLSGAAFAADQSSVDQNQNDTYTTRHRVRRDAQQAGQDVRTGYEQSKQDLNQNTSDLKQDANRAGSDLKQGAANVGDQAAEKTEQAGSSLAQGIREGSDTLRGEHKPMAMGTLRSGKDVSSTLTTDAVGTVTGDGLNVDYEHSLGNKFGWDVGGRYARTTLGVGAVNSFGVRGGADYFIIGRHNEGLRIGPRLEVGLGSSSGGSFGGTVGNFAAAAELGYNWISSSGLTAGLAGGLRDTVGGNPLRALGAPSTANSFGPYGKLNIGYSW